MLADFKEKYEKAVKLENEIAFIRQGFNDAVTQYDTRLQTFPDNLLAGMFGMKSRTLLRFEEAAHQVPTVSFEPAS